MEEKVKEKVENQTKIILPGYVWRARGHGEESESESGKLG